MSVNEIKAEALEEAADAMTFPERVVTYRSFWRPWKQVTCVVPPTVRLAHPLWTRNRAAELRRAVSS